MIYVVSNSSEKKDIFQMKNVMMLRGNVRNYLFDPNGFENFEVGEVNDFMK